tara:strand:- start:2730 stop:2942 length:213 start_codon:yes stop_codon:yes gene_type:complete
MNRNASVVPRPENVETFLECRFPPEAPISGVSGGQPHPVPGSSSWRLLALSLPVSWRTFPIGIPYASVTA